MASRMGLVMASRMGLVLIALHAGLAFADSAPGACPVGATAHECQAQAAIDEASALFQGTVKQHRDLTRTDAVERQRMAMMLGQIAELFSLPTAFINLTFHISVDQEVGNFFPALHQANFSTEELGKLWGEYTGDDKGLMTDPNKLVKDWGANTGTAQGIMKVLLHKMYDVTKARYVFICKSDSVVNVKDEDVVEKLVIKAWISGVQVPGGKFEAYAFNGYGCDNTLERTDKPKGWSNWAWLSPPGDTTHEDPDIVMFGKQCPGKSKSWFKRFWR